MLEKGQITEDAWTHLITQTHLSGSGGHTEKMSPFVDHFINSLLHLKKCFERDSPHMINILKDICNLTPDTKLCTLDGFSL